jgi:hypothetical protein
LQPVADKVRNVLDTTDFIDIHTHLFAPEFGNLGLSGIDELLTYHYLEAELFRFGTISPNRYFAQSKPQRADTVWRTLFVDHSPLSEAARGVIAVLHAFDLPTASPSLNPIRQFFKDQKPEDHLSNVLRLAGISSVVMTNDPWDPNEAPLWSDGFRFDSRFLPALRLDRILNDPSQLRSDLEVRHQLDDWVTRMRPVYMAVSLPDSFEFPTADQRTGLLINAVLPACRAFGIPLALMIGVRRQVNPAIGLAGDASGRADMRALEALCCDHPENTFLVTVLSRENQHELCVYARKFANLIPFGCWWFLNNPSMVEEITRERLEMLGTTFIPQHSDARILEQLIYKWRNTRRTLAPVLAKSYELMREDGRPVARADIERDVTRLFRGNFEQLCPNLSSPRIHP